MIKELAAIFDRLARAEEQLKEIERKLLSYYNSDPCTMSGEYDPNAEGRGTARIMVDSMNVRLNTLIGEFLHDIRSSLDHLAWQLVLHNKGYPTADTTFPILKTAPPTNKHGQRTLPNIAGGISQTARAVIDSSQPYQFGPRYTTHPLWMLHQLWNIDKHRHVIARGGWPERHFVGANLPRFTYTARFESATPNMARYSLIPDDPSVNVKAYLTI
jgi:hypothetical protein